MSEEQQFLAKYGEQGARAVEALASGKTKNIVPVLAELVGRAVGIPGGAILAKVALDQPANTKLDEQITQHHEHEQLRLHLQPALDRGNASVVDRITVVLEEALADVFDQLARSNRSLAAATLAELKAELPGLLGRTGTAGDHDSPDIKAALGQLSRRMEELNTRMIDCGPPQPRLIAREALVGTSLVGRDQTIAEVSALLCAPDGPRAVFLVGMGGAGKTSLAGAIATQDDVEDSFPDGTFWFEAQRVYPAAALAHIATTLGIELPAETSPALQDSVLRSRLRACRFLLVLDDVWNEEERSRYDVIGPRSVLLATTRDESIASDATTNVVRVDAVAPTAALTLLQRMTAPHPAAEEDLRTLASLVGHLPLALDLVGRRAAKALRVPGYALSELVRELSEEEARLSLGTKDRSVRAVLNTSWERALDDASRRRFALLGIFDDGALDVEAVARIWEAPDGREAIRGLSALADLSLVSQPAHGMFRLHPLIRSLAAEKLASFPAVVAREAHLRAADLYFERAERAGEPTVAEDIDPIINSFVHAADGGDKDRANRVFPWFRTGANRLLAVPGFLLQRGRTRTLVRLRRKAVTLARSSGLAPEGWARYWLADCLVSDGQPAEALKELRCAEALSLQLTEGARELLDRRIVYKLAQVHQLLGDTAGALATFERDLERARRSASVADELLAMLQIGDLVLHQQPPDRDRALAVYEEVRALAARENRPDHEAMALTRIAEMMLDTEPQRAINDFEKALTLGGAPGQGARYLLRIANGFSALAAGGHPTGARAFHTYKLAFEGTSGHLVERLSVLHDLGAFFEQLIDAAGRPRHVVAALACYELAVCLMKPMERPPDIDFRARIDRLRAHCARTGVSAPDSLTPSAAEAILSEALSTLGGLLRG